MQWTTKCVNLEKSIEAFTKAKRVIAGGVNSPVRAFKSVGGAPVFIRLRQRRIRKGY